MYRLKIEGATEVLETTDYSRLLKAVEAQVISGGPKVITITID